MVIAIFKELYGDIREINIPHVATTQALIWVAELYRELLVVDRGILLDLSTIDHCVPHVRDNRNSISSNQFLLLVLLHSRLNRRTSFLFRDESLKVLFLVDDNVDVLLRNRELLFGERDLDAGLDRKDNGLLGSH